MKKIIDSNDVIIELPNDLEYAIMDNIVSNYYWEKHYINRIEIIINKPGIYTTKIKLIS